MNPETMPIETVAESLLYARECLQKLEDLKLITMNDISILEARIEREVKIV